MAIDGTSITSRRALAGWPDRRSRGAGRPGVGPTRAGLRRRRRAGRGRYRDPTTIPNTSPGETCFSGIGTGAGIGVRGQSETGPGVRGSGFKGVYGLGDSTGVWGAGVTGVSGTGDTGVFGHGTERGVHGVSETGTAVTAQPGPAPRSRAQPGPAPRSWRSRDRHRGHGAAGTGTGVFGQSDTGYALYGHGRVYFTYSGLANVAVGTNTKTVTPGDDLASQSCILCTLESNQSGLSIHRVTKNATADTFTVILSANVQSGRKAKVAWFVIN